MAVKQRESERLGVLMMISVRLFVRDCRLS